MQKKCYQFGIFLIILITIGIFYWGFQQNYFFSDDFAWLGRAVLLQDSPGELLKVEGRDFNPVYLGLLGILLKIFGLSPLSYRILSLLIFSAVTWMFFYILARHFKVNNIIAVSAALLSGSSVFVSEAVLDLAALVYSLSLFFALAALHFYLSQAQPAAASEKDYHPGEQNQDRPTHLSQRFLGWNKQKGLFWFFLILAFLTKETIILVVFPLFLYEKEKKSRLFIAAAAGGLVLLRVLLQMTAAAGSYTSFLSFSHFFYKLYFIILRTMNLSPYTIPLPVGIGLIILLLLVSFYIIKAVGRGVEASPVDYEIRKPSATRNLFEKRFLDFPKLLKMKILGAPISAPQDGPKDLMRDPAPRGILFFLGYWGIFSVVFALLPKLSSRYFLYPALGFWGIVASIAHYFYKKKEYLKYALVPLLLISLLINYPLVKREIEDYRILGDFSREFIRAEKAAVENQLSGNPVPTEIMFYKGDMQPLAGVYRQIIQRENLPKLLPFRANSIGGVIEPKHLIPIIFYPARVSRWNQLRETSSYISGRIE